MRVPSRLKLARLNILRTAELFDFNPDHLRRLIRRNVMPRPKSTNKGRPYYDYALLCRMADVMTRGVGVNGEEIMFYSRRRKQSPQSPPRRSRLSPSGADDHFVRSIIDACLQLGIGKDKLSPAVVASILRQEFGKDHPELRDAVPAVARKILGEKG